MCKPIREDLLREIYAREAKIKEIIRFREFMKEKEISVRLNDEITKERNKINNLRKELEKNKKRVFIDFKGNREVERT